MPILLITRGLPGSGKTTYAKRLPYVRVNRDDIRILLHGGYVGTWEAEQEVSQHQQDAVWSLLQSGLSVVVDDTNLRLKHARAWATMAARAGADFSCVDFLDVPIDVCIARDATREKPVGEDVILGMAARYGRLDRMPYPVADTVETPPAEPYIPDPLAPRAVMVDIDGTLALHGSRDPYDTSRYAEDTVNEPVAHVVQLLIDDGYTIIYCSGRSEEFRDVTWAWLGRSLPVDTATLLMRPSGDTRRDDIVKLELFDKHVRDRYNVHMVLDDRDRVVAAWRRIGLTVLQVAPGDF